MGKGKTGSISTPKQFRQGVFNLYSEKEYRQMSMAQVKGLVDTTSPCAFLTCETGLN